MSERESIGHMFNRALKCETREQADEWMKAEIKDFQRLYGYSPEQSASIIRHNLGYMTGYYDYPVRQKIFVLFDAEHPVFGKPDDWPSDPRAIFNKGVEMGKKLRGQS